MAWERGAWERTARGESYRDSNDSSSYGHSNDIIKESEYIPKKVNNSKKNLANKKNLAKFISNGWSVSTKKKDQYLNNNFFNASYRLNDYVDISEKICNLINTKSNKHKILVVSNNELILDNIQLEFTIKDNYKIFKSSKSANQLEILMDCVEEFEKINSNLFNNYAIKIFSDVDSINQIQDLKILSENLYYIDNNEAKLLNDFLKSYWKFYELSNFSNVDLSLAERNVTSEVNNHVNELNSLEKYIKRLKNILNKLDLKIDALEDINIEILESNPFLINSSDANNFVSLLEKYHKINFLNNLSSAYIKEFLSNNFILGIIANFKRYVDGQNYYYEINNDIIDLKNQFKSKGLNFDNLNQYYEIKDKLDQYENILFVDDDGYLTLNDKIKEFLKNNISFNDYFKRCRNNVIFNLDSNSIYLNVNNNLNNILNICNDLGVKIDSLSDFDDYQKNFKILMDYINFNKKSTVANEDTINEYANSLFDDLKEICIDLINNADEVDRSELDYIVYNISTLKRLINKIGLNLFSLNELKDSFPVIANIEKDISNSIFSNQTEVYLQNDKFIIHNDLDLLKSTLDYLFEKIGDDSVLKNYPIDNLSQSFNNQYKIEFLKSNIESYITSTNTFDEILQNYEVIIQNMLNLMEANNDFKYKNDVDRILKNLNSISKMHANKNYSTNQLIIDSISSYKNSIINDFNQLVKNGIFSRDKVENCDVETCINELNNDINDIRAFINTNSAYNLNFHEIIENNRNIILKNDEIRNKFETCTLYNFFDVCKESKEYNYNYDIVKEILDLSLKLDLKEYDEFADFELDDISNLSKYLEDSIEFSEFVKKGLIDKSFNISEFQSNEFNSKIESIKSKLIDLKLDSSIIADFSQIDVGEVEGIKEKLNQIDKYLKIDSCNVDELIQNNQFVIDALLNLCNDYYIEFEINNNKFNSSDFKLKLNEIKDDMNSQIRLYELEKEILSYSEIIENNLSEIWNGLFTDITLVKNKIQIDVEFTKLFNNGILTQKSLNNISKISKSDLIFLQKFKNMDAQKLKYITFYKNYDLLSPEIDRLNNINKEDLNSFLDTFININKIFKSNNIGDCITLLEYNIKHTDSIRLINEYEDKLRSYSLVYYKYFDKNKFDMTIDEIIHKIDMHFKFTSLVDNKIINERYLDSIKSNFNDFLKQVNLLIDLENKIIKGCNECFGEINISFDEIKQKKISMDNSNLVLMNLSSLRNSFNKNYVSYFDYVYVVDNNDLTSDDELHLFLISKNKLSYFNLRDG